MEGFQDITSLVSQSLKIITISYTKELWYQLTLTWIILLDDCVTFCEYTLCEARYDMFEKPSKIYFWLNGKEIPNSFIHIQSNFRFHSDNTLFSYKYETWAEKGFNKSLCRATLWDIHRAISGDVLYFPFRSVLSRSLLIHKCTLIGTCLTGFITPCVKVKYVIVEDQIRCTYEKKQKKHLLNISLHGFN